MMWEWNDVNKNMVNNNKTTTSKSFIYETKIIGSATTNYASGLNAEVFVSLKSLFRNYKARI